MPHDQEGRVFVIARPTVKRDGSTPDLTPLELHGPITFLVDEHVKPSRTPEDAFDAIEQRLENFDHRHDKIAWAGGDMLSAIMTGVCLADLNIPYFTFLRYERDFNPVTRERFSTGYYSPVKVIMDPVVCDERQGELFSEEGDTDASQ